MYVCGKYRQYFLETVLILEILDFGQILMSGISRARLSRA